VVKELKNRFRGIEVVFSCGGSGLIKVNDGEGEKICNDLEKIYSEKVPGSSLTAVCHKGENDFSTLLKKLSVKLRIEKNRKALNEKGSTINGNFENRCTTCGKMERKYEINIGGEREYICGSCNRKYEKTKDEGYPVNMESLPFNRETQPNITFIYCDLNNAGNILFSCKDEKNLKEKSSLIYNTISQIMNNVKSATKDNFNFHIITPVIGGDDLIFLVPAERTFDVLNRIFEGEKELKNIQTSFSVSFVISHYHTSIYHLFTVAKESLKRAKKIYYEDYTPGIDFVWLREGMPFKEYEENREVVLTNKPYKRDDFEKVRRIAEDLLERNIPPSYLYNLLEIIEGRENENYKKINLFYYVVRNNEMSEVIKSSCNNNLNLEDVYKFFIVQKGLNYYYSQFSDVMELYKILKLGSEK